jgi:alanine dehydrogenase
MIGFTDQMYEKSGARIVGTPKEVYKSEMIIKVKEPQDAEFPLMHEGQILFCYLHLAPDLKQTKKLLEQKVVGIAFETITDDQGRLPLLVPMSEVAGRLSIQVGATALQLNNGGKGVLLGGTPGVKKGRVVIIGGGIVGTEAMKMALGLGADVTILDNNLSRLRELDTLYSPALKTVYSTTAAIEEAISHADLVIGAVLIPGAKAPNLITKDMLKLMQEGTVLVDVAIDQGGCFETSKATTHSNPTFVVDGIIHYCVANMPGACAKTSTQGLTNAIMPYAFKIAKNGWKKAMEGDDNLKMGLNVCLGEVTNKSVAAALDFVFVNPAEIIK